MLYLVFKIYSRPHGMHTFNMMTGTGNEERVICFTVGFEVADGDSRRVA